MALEELAQYQGKDREIAEEVIMVIARCYHDKQNEATLQVTPKPQPQPYTLSNMLKDFYYGLTGRDTGSSTTWDGTEAAAIDATYLNLLENYPLDTNLANVLGFDDIDQTALEMMLETKFGEFFIPDKDAEKLTTIRGCVDYIISRNMVNP
jgi:acyl carrier protein